uniref:Uncharacterized protein n=1 Tax=Hanusia phi TaxID=3032 RepID=A0A7S0DWZ8_9CRYP
MASRPSNDVATSHHARTPKFSDAPSEHARRWRSQVSEGERRSRVSSHPHPHPPSVDAGHEFFSFALSELGHAPNINKLRRSFHEDRAKPVEMKADATETSRMSQLSAVYGDRASSKRSSPKYALAPETRESGGEKAYDFARSLSSKKEADAQKRQQRRALDHDHQDMFGIPEGREEGIKLGNHHSKEHRTMGISSREAQSDISSYFNQLVSSAREAKHHPSSHHYFQTKDARQESLAQVSSKSPVLARNLHINEYKAAEQNLEKKVMATAQQAKTALDNVAQGSKSKGFSDEVEIQERVDAAAKEITQLAKDAEKSIKKTSEQTAMKFQKTLEGYNKQGAGIKDAFEDRLDAAAVKLTDGPSHASRHHERPVSSSSPERREKVLSSGDARKQLFDSMDSIFSSTQKQDEEDERRLTKRNKDPSTSSKSILDFLDERASRDRKKDLEDEQHLIQPTSTSPQQALRRLEREQSSQEEEEYADALKDALQSGSGKNSPPLPVRPIPTN